MTDNLLIAFCSFLLLPLGTREYFCPLTIKKCHVECMHREVLVKASLCVSQPQYTVNSRLPRSHWPNSTNLCTHSGNSAFFASLLSISQLLSKLLKSSWCKRKIYCSCCFHTSPAQCTICYSAKLYILPINNPNEYVYIGLYMLDTNMCIFIIDIYNWYQASQQTLAPVVGHLFTKPVPWGL